MNRNKQKFVQKCVALRYCVNIDMYVQVHLLSSFALILMKIVCNSYMHD